MNVSIAENEGKSRTVRRRAGRTGCSVEATLSVIGGVWKPVLLFHLLGGKLRFNAICRLTPNATQRMITLQLRELEADGIVERTVFPEVPPRVEYALTPLGRTLKPVLLSMRSWGADFQAGLDGERDATTAAAPCAEASISAT
jgi:DNA-binding HxlR family transcriptional regulator